YGPHESRLAASGARVHVGAFGEEQLDDFRIAGAGSYHYRCLAEGKRGVRVGAGVEEFADHGCASILGGGPEGRDAEIIGCIHLGAGAEQQSGAFYVIVVAGPEEGRRAVWFGCVDVGLFLDQGAQGGLVAVADGNTGRNACATGGYTGKNACNHEL